MKSLFSLFLIALLLASCADDESFSTEIIELQEVGASEIQSNEVNVSTVNKSEPERPCLVSTGGKRDKNGCCQYRISYSWPFGQFGVEHFLLVNGIRVEDPTYFLGSFIWDITICEDAEIELWTENIFDRTTSKICGSSLECENTVDCNSQGPDLTILNLHSDITDSGVFALIINSASLECPIVQTKWYFGDNSSCIVGSGCTMISNTGHVFHQYEMHGDYWVTAVVTDDCGCTYSEQIRVHID